MPNYAVIQDGTVVNVILADDDAESVLALLLPEADEFIVPDDTTGPAYIGGDLHDGRFRPPAPFPSWEWDGDAAWQPPIPYPGDGAAYEWNEEQGGWVAIPPQSEPAPEDDSDA